MKAAPEEVVVVRAAAYYCWRWHHYDQNHHSNARTNCHCSCCQKSWGGNQPCRHVLVARNCPACFLDDNWYTRTLHCFHSRRRTILSACCCYRCYFFHPAILLLLGIHPHRSLLSTLLFERAHVAVVVAAVVPSSHYLSTAGSALHVDFQSRIRNRAVQRIL